MNTLKNMKKLRKIPRKIQPLWNELPHKSPVSLWRLAKTKTIVTKEDRLSELISKRLSYTQKCFTNIQTVKLLIVAGELLTGVRVGVWLNVAELPLGLLLI